MSCKSIAGLCSVIVALASAFTAQCGEKVVKNGDKVVFMGDSITHYGVERSHGYVNLTVQGLAANGINVQWAGRGVPGEKASQMRARFQHDVIDQRPDVVTIAAGVNDVLIAESAPASGPEDVEAMIQMAQAAGITPVVMTPTFAQFSAENGDVTRDYAQTVRGYAAKYGIPLADAWQAVTDWKNDAANPYLEYQLHYKVTIDGVHMAPSGDREMARALLRAMGLDESEMAKAEAAWNADERVYAVNPAVKISHAQLLTFKQAAANAGVGGGEFAKTVFRRGLASLAKNPSVESNYTGSDAESFSAGFTINMADYDTLLRTSVSAAYQPADKNRGHLDATIGMAMLRGLRECEAGEPVEVVPAEVQTGLFAHAITLTTSGYAGSSELTDFPVAVRLAANSPAGFSYADMADSTRGNELRFAGADGMSLDYDVEAWDPNGTSLVWVKLPKLTKTTSFTMYYGGRPTDDVTASRTWSADYVGVWHMSEEDDTVSDSSGNGLAASVEQFADGIQSAASGVFGKARVNSAKRNHTTGRALLKVSDSYLLDLGGDFTFSSWVKMTETTDGSLARIAVRGADGGGNPEWEVALSDAVTVKAKGGSGSAQTGTIPSVLDNWVHVAAVYNGTLLTVYANGAKAFEGEITAVKDSNNKLCFGTKGGVYDGHFTGLFDEFRLRDAVSSADWVKAEYDQAGTSFLSGEGGGGGPAEDPTGAIAASGDKTGATDTQKIQTLLDAAENGVVTLGSGVFYVNAQLLLTNGVTLAGQGWSKTIIRQVGSGRVMKLSSGSTAKGVTVTGGRINTAGTYVGGGGVLIENGTLSWCCVSNNTLVCGNVAYGGGVGFMSGKGSVDHCIISDNTVSAVNEYMNYGGGIGVYQSSGAITVDSCLIYGNTSVMTKGHRSGRGGGIGVSFGYNKAKVAVRNSTIVGNVAGAADGDNRDKSHGGAVYVESVNSDKQRFSMVNCIIANNKTVLNPNHIEVYDASGVDSCLFDSWLDRDAVLNDGAANCMSGNPKFANASAGDYTLASDSPARSAGTTYVGIGQDLSGTAFANPPSMGCYEYEGEGSGEGEGQGEGEGEGEGGQDDPPLVTPTGDFRKAVTFTTSGYQGASTLENFPVLVRLSTAISGFSYADFGGAQCLLFKDAAGNVLPHEIESWNTSGTSYVWVEVPAVDRTTSFTMYYCGSSASATASADMWTGANYVGVWHMAEASGDAVDATGHGLSAVQKGTDQSVQVSTSGAIGAARVSATSSSKTYFEVANDARLDVGDAFTVSGWYNMSAANDSGAATVVGRQQGWFTTDGWMFEFAKSGTAFSARGASNSSNNRNAKGSMPSAVGDWVHFALVYNGASVTVYANGAQVETTGDINAAKDNETAMMFGYGNTRTYFYGSFDEFRLRDATASADWVKAEYDQAGGAFLTNGDVQSVGGRKSAAAFYIN